MEGNTHVQNGVNSAYLEEFEVGVKSEYATKSSGNKVGPKQSIAVDVAGPKPSEYACDLVRKAVSAEAKESVVVLSASSERGQATNTSRTGSSISSYTGSVNSSSAASLLRTARGSTGTAAEIDVESWLNNLPTARDGLLTAQTSSDPAFTANSRTLLTGQTTSDPAVTANSRTMLTAQTSSDPAFTANSCTMVTGQTTSDPALTAKSRTILTAQTTSDPALTAKSRTMLTAQSSSDLAVTAKSRTILTAQTTSDPALTALSRAILTAQTTSDPALTALSRTILTAQTTSDPAVTANSCTMVTGQTTSDPVRTAASHSYNSAFGDISVHTADVMRTANDVSANTARSQRSTTKRSSSTHTANELDAIMTAIGADTKTAKESISDVKTAIEELACEMNTTPAAVINTAMEQLNKSSSARPSTFALTHTPEFDLRAAHAMPSVDDTTTAIEQ